ncbi:unnamed protein product [Blepharisma stoltei]|uniref:Uncharacterized protein n=1 Tax=Blepharisma stoltei TaxID=1481888 RepID=A0AAU9JC51_9CILI|nr:unnamed protein product [Blepharisma stoltei]
MNSQSQYSDYAYSSGRNVRFEDLCAENSSNEQSNRIIPPSPLRSSLSFMDEDPQSVSDSRSQVTKLQEKLSKCIQNANDSHKKASNLIMLLDHEKIEFLKLAEKVANQEYKEKSFSVEKHREKVSLVLNDLKSQEKNLLKEMNSLHGPSEAYISLAWEKLEKINEILNGESVRIPKVSFEIEIISRKAIEDLKERCYLLSKECDRLKDGMRTVEYTPDTARHGPKRSIRDMETELSELKESHDVLMSEKKKVEEDNEKLSKLSYNDQELDHYVTHKIFDLIKMLQDFSNPRIESDSWLAYKSTFKEEKPIPDSISHLKCIDDLERLEQSIVSTLKFQQDKIKFKDQVSEKLLASLKKSSIEEARSLNMKQQTLQEEIRQEERFLIQREIDKLSSVNNNISKENQRLKEENDNLKQALDEENYRYEELNEKYINLKLNQEQEIENALRSQEYTFEQKLKNLKTETQDILIEDDNKWKLKSERLEEELREVKKQLEESAQGRNPQYERELQYVRTIYNDKYEELFRITTAQINELEQKLKENEHNKQAVIDLVCSKIRKEEQEIREKEFQRINQLHARELKLLNNEFEEFVMKAQAETKRLAIIVDQALLNTESTVLKGVQSEIRALESQLSQKHKKSKEDSLSLSYSAFEDSAQFGESQKSCKRCGMNDKTSRECKFHPFLVTAGSGDFLYGKEWHKCRENGHDQNTPPCMTCKTHYYGMDKEGKNSFIKICEEFNPETMTFMDGFKKIPAQESSAEMSSYKEPQISMPLQKLDAALFYSERKQEPYDKPRLSSEKVSATKELEGYLSKYRS